MRAQFVFAALMLLVSVPARADPPKLAIFDFELDDSDMDAMSALTREGSRFTNEPQWVGRWD